MAYLGNDLQVAFPVYRNIDDISGSFNSSTTSFPLRVSGVAPVPAPLYSQQCLISVGGVVQRPDDSGSEGFRLSGGNIIFASAPTTGADFFGIILAGADYINAGGNFPSGTAAVPSITFNDDLDTGIYNSGINQVSITTGGSERLRIDSAGQIESVSLGTAAAPAFSFTTDPNTGIYSPGADQVAVSTGGSGRLFVDASGRVGVGTSSPSVKLEVSDVTSSNPEIRVVDGTVNTQWYASDNGVCIFGTFSNHPQVFRTNGIERLRIDASGRLLVGTSSAQGGGRIQVQGSNVESKLTMWRDNAPFGFIDGTAGSSIEFGASPSSGVFGIGASIQFFGDQTWGSNDYPGRLVFSTTADGASSPTERLRIDSSGRVGVGTTSPGAELNIVKNLSGGLGAQLIVENQFGNAGSEAAILCRTNLVCKAGLHVVADDGGTGTGNGNYLYFTTTPGGSTTESERARIDRSGRLLVGTSSARSGVFFNGDALAPTIQLEGTTSSTCYSATRVSDGGGDAVFVFAKARGATVGSTTVVQNGDGLGTITFQGADGSEFVEAARISVAVDGTPGVNDMPGRLVFSTTADGASSPTERMRITNDGQTYFGITGNTGLGTTNRGFLIRNELAGKTYVQLASTGTTTDTVFYFYNGNGLVGSISMNGSATAYNTSSDYRLKENVAPVPDGITRLQQLKPSRFNFIADPATTVDGFIAHEVQAVVPEAITGEKDAVDNDGNPQYQGIDQSKLVPLLTAALQEAIAKIESLEARLTAAGI